MKAETKTAETETKTAETETKAVKSETKTAETKTKASVNWSRDQDHDLKDLIECNS